MSVFEMRGVFASGGTGNVPAQWVRLDQCRKHVRLQVDNKLYPPLLTPDDARCLAGQLLQLAARIDARNKENK